MHKAVPKERSKWKKKWTDTNEKKLGLLFSVLFLQGIVKKLKQEYYWSKYHMLQASIFQQVIQKDRFILWTQFLHLTNVILLYSQKTTRKIFHKNFLTIHEQITNANVFYEQFTNANVFYEKDNTLLNIMLLVFCLQITELSIQMHLDGNSSVYNARCSSTFNQMKLTTRHFASHVTPNLIK